MALEFIGTTDSWVTLDLPSHPTDIYISCEVYVTTTEIAWMNDVNGGEVVVNIHSDYGDARQGLSIQPNAPSDFAWFDQNDLTFTAMAHPILVAGAYTLTVHATADPINGDASADSVNAGSTLVATGSGDSNSYATYYDRVDLGLYLEGYTDARRDIFIRNITIGTTPGGTELLSNAGTLSGWSSTTGSVAEADWPTETPPPPEVSTGGVRIGVAFDDPTLEATPTWTYLTDTPNLVAGYEKQVGRQFEFDKTEAGTAKVTVLDRDGVLDPTNTTGPYYGLIEPLLQIQIELWNPITLDYHSRFRGFIEDYDYVVEPYTHQDSGGNTVGLTRLEISCIDLFPICTAIEMQPDGSFGDDPSDAATDASGNIFFGTNPAHDRIGQVLTNALGATFFGARCIVFTLNVNVQETIYSPGQNVLEVIQDACDAEFPTVSNVYCDRFGRLVVHGRLAKFDPAGTASDAGADAWDFHAWKIGDGKAVVASPTDTAHIRSFAFNRGWSKIHNYAICTPKGIDDPPTVPGTSDIPGQVSKDTTSIAQYGYQSWTATELIIGALSGDPLVGVAGILTGLNALEETKLIADFVVANYKVPQNRVSDVTFRSISPDATGAAANWEFLCKVDIADTAACYIRGPGDGPTEYIFNGEVFFVEGVRETVLPLAGDYANVTTTLDLSPKANFTPGAWSGD